MWDLPPPPSAATREDGLVDEQLPESRPGADQGRTASSLTASGPQVASPTSKLSPATQVALDFETRFGWALIVMLVVEAQLTVTVGVVMPLSSEGPITAERNNTLGTSGGQLRGSSIDGHLGGRRSGPYSGGGGGGILQDQSDLEEHRALFDANMRLHSAWWCCWNQCSSKSEL